MHQPHSDGLKNAQYAGSRILMNLSLSGPEHDDLMKYDAVQIPAKCNTFTGSGALQELNMAVDFISRLHKHPQSLTFVRTKNVQP